MKKILFLAAIAATVGFTACDKNNEPVNPAAGESVVVVKLPDNVTTTRVVEAPVAGNSVNAVISDVTVFLLAGDVVAMTYDFLSGDLSAKKAHIENVPSSVNSVLVVANIPSDAAAVKTLTSGVAIKNYPYTIASQNGAGTITKQTLMGSTAQLTSVTPDPTHPERNYKECTVTLDALTARFEINGVSAGTGIKTVEIVGVWINAFYTTAKKDLVQTYTSSATVWDVTPPALTLGIPSATPFTGYTLATYPYADYHNAGNAGVIATEDPTSVYAYQVFAGTNIPHLILLVKGEYLTEQTEGANDKYFMGYVTFTKFNDGTGNIASVENNTIYKVGHTEKGIIINGGNITPEPELENYDLGIEVEVKGWTDKHVTPGL